MGRARTALGVDKIAMLGSIRGGAEKRRGQFQDHECPRERVILPGERVILVIDPENQ